MINLRAQHDIRNCRQSPEERAEVQGLAHTFEQGLPTLFPRRTVGILFQKPGQQFFAVGRRTAVIFVRLHGDLPCTAPYQI